MYDSRNVAFKMARMREAIMEDQDEFLMRKSEYEEVGVEINNKSIRLRWSWRT